MPQIHLRDSGAKTTNPETFLSHKSKDRIVQLPWRSDPFISHGAIAPSSVQFRFHPAPTVFGVNTSSFQHRAEAFT